MVDLEGGERDRDDALLLVPVLARPLDTDLLASDQVTSYFSIDKGE